MLNIQLTTTEITPAPTRSEITEMKLKCCSSLQEPKKALHVKMG